MANGELLDELTVDESTYDAHIKDIAVLNFYHGDPEFAGNRAKYKDKMEEKQTPQQHLFWKKLHRFINK